MKTIYNTYVEMESQEQCDRMKQLCIDNGLPIWNDIDAFTIEEDFGNQFFKHHNDFAVLFNSDKIKITEKEFIKLLQDERN